MVPEKQGAQKRKNKMYRRSLRLGVIGAYGGKRACCGESRLEFLSIGHIHGGGNRHRKQLQKPGIDLYLWLRKHGYPPGYRVLCHNCNFSHGIYGYCPHIHEKYGLLSNEADSLAGVKNEVGNSGL